VRKTLNLARELKRRGIRCTLSSARSFSFSLHIAEDLDIDIPIVTYDGALIKDKAGNILYSGKLKDKVVSKAIKLAESNYGKIGLCDDDGMFITQRHSVIKEYAKISAKIKEVPNYDDVKNIIEILIYCEDKASQRHIKERFKFPNSIGVNFSVSKSPRSDYYLLTIKKKGSDKLTSIKRLVKHLGLKRKNVAVIGDWHNDMPLFEFGGYNIAVQNAIPELKRKADYITHSTNNEDAVGRSS
jgi:Cof subfamily protein (haloacid dehalogenase superfamily)